MVAVCFWLSPPRLHFVTPPVAERSAVFQIPLLGAMATVLAVICAAVIMVVTLTRKVMTLAAHLSHGHPPPPRRPFMSPSCPEKDQDVVSPPVFRAFLWSLLCLFVKLFMLFCPLPGVGTPPRKAGPVCFPSCCHLQFLAPTCPRSHSLERLIYLL